MFDSSLTLISHFLLILKNFQNASLTLICSYLSQISIKTKTSATMMDLTDVDKDPKNDYWTDNEDEIEDIYREIHYNIG